MALLKLERQSDPQPGSSNSKRPHRSQAETALLVLAYLGGVVVIPVVLLPVMGLVKALFGAGAGGDEGLLAAFLSWVILTLVSWAALGYHAKDKLSVGWAWAYLAVVSLYLGFLIALFLNAYFGA